ncbi:unnamed protein product [Arabidopsis lyrata]|uniref:uncharacterized protein LOC110224787 n=1 Tax=Arabidopsis lyrata subsp. lyrata TaxID=81972 RepID=UPI000A29BEA8|nr:uncharacterized protein LOC110224787 [Arabidopsis lyrata subsp. lyrata]CAH8253837.1 unnamed protein product [Arabidopsis lyrata]|eukprot:XP_020867608.1 uncharacterized protein LOC110224787 [Arabidopsis lyrata subsp. lyrata]
MFDAAKEELLNIPDTRLPQELSDSRLIGTSHGWGFFSNLCDRSLCISDYLNPLSSTSNPKVISLPPLTSLYTCQTQVLCNVAMSSSPCDHEDWVVALKFLGRQLSLCRPNRDLRWTNILTPFTFLENSNLMYSKRDHKFYLPAPGSNHLCSLDLQFKKDHNPKFHKFLYHNRPKLSQREHELLSSCSKAEHWVESPSGERFLVKCYSYFSQFLDRVPVFMVFREEETTEKGTIMCYTEDIGDVCIFISGTDPFCVEASLCPGLVPNSIYLMESIFGVYDLTTRSIRHFEDQVEWPPKPEEVEFAFLPYWLPPISI